MPGGGGPRICERGGAGLFYAAGWDVDVDTVPRAILVVLFLGWTFLGVAIVADIFMVSIERITSTEKTVRVFVGDERRPRRVHVKVSWLLLPEIHAIPDCCVLVRPTTTIRSGTRRSPT